MNSMWITDLNAKHETAKLPENNVEEEAGDLGLLTSL